MTDWKTWNNNVSIVAAITKIVALAAASFAIFYAEVAEPFANYVELPIAKPSACINLSTKPVFAMLA